MDNVALPSGLQSFTFQDDGTEDQGLDDDTESDAVEEGDRADDYSGGDFQDEDDHEENNDIMDM